MGRICWVLSLMVSLSSIALVVANVEDDKVECPPKYKNAYLDGGDYCCMYDEEKSCDVEGVGCDGSKFDKRTRCCKGDKFKRCPGYKDGKKCKNYNCRCNTNHTIKGNKTCDDKGQCYCKSSRGGLTCDGCADDHYKNMSYCMPCACDDMGAMNSSCTDSDKAGKGGGMCYCKDGNAGLKCDYKKIEKQDTLAAKSTEKWIATCINNCKKLTVSAYSADGAKHNFDLRVGSGSNNKEYCEKTGDKAKHSCPEISQAKESLVNIEVENKAIAGTKPFNHKLVVKGPNLQNLQKLSSRRK